MPCDNCGTNYTNNTPKECRFSGLKGDYCCQGCADEAEPDVDFSEQRL